MEPKYMSGDRSVSNSLSFAFLAVWLVEKSEAVRRTLPGPEVCASLLKAWVEHNLHKIDRYLCTCNSVSEISRSIRRRHVSFYLAHLGLPSSHLTRLVLRYVPVKA